MKKTFDLSTSASWYGINFVTMKTSLFCINTCQELSLEGSDQVECALTCALHIMSCVVIITAKRKKKKNERGGGVSLVPRPCI